MSSDITKETSFDYTATEIVEEEFQYTDTDVVEEEFEYTDTGVVEDEPAYSNVSATADSLFVLPGEEQDYTITQRTLGKGGQAMVFPCKGNADGEDYVLKLYRRNMIKEEKLVEVLEILERGNNPYVTKVIEHGICEWGEEERYYVVMPKYEPLPRSKYIFANNKGNPEYEKDLQILIRCLNNGISFLHSNNIFHGDIKPNNIMWNEEDECAVLIDFGGSVSTDEEGHTMNAPANTQRYLPQEAQGINIINEWVDYFAMGVTIAEFIDGIYPKRVDVLQKKVGEVYRIGYYGVPKALKAPFINLICGLLYENEEESIMLQNRWNNGDVKLWLKLMNKGDITGATTYKNVREVAKTAGIPAGVQAEASAAIDDRRKYMFVNGQVLNLTIGDETIACDSLPQVADALARRWSEGIDVMLQMDEEEQFDPVKMGKDLYRIIRMAREKMQNVDTNKCESINAEFFKFLYRFLSDKQTFRWEDLPGITNKELFAVKFRSALNTVRSNGGNFGDWWKNMYDDSKSSITVFAEIFKNQIFSTYLKANNEQNEQLLEQCKKVEDIFYTPKSAYSIEEMCEMYRLVFELLGEKGKVFVTAHGTKYSSYQDFAMEIRQCLTNKQNPEQIFKVWKSVTEGEYFAPDFFAWLQAYAPQYAKSIKHNLNIT